jgi:hypothetical protein
MGAPRLAYGPDALPEGGGHWTAGAGFHGVGLPPLFFWPGG